MLRGSLLFSVHLLCLLCVPEWLPNHRRFPSRPQMKRSLLWLDQTELHSGFSWVMRVKTRQTDEVFTVSGQWSYAEHTNTHNKHTTRCSKVWMGSSTCGAIHDCICWLWCCVPPKEALGPTGLSVNETDWRRGPTACCFSNWVSTGNLDRLWRYNENFNDFYRQARPTVRQLAPLFCLFGI